MGRCFPRESHGGFEPTAYDAQFIALADKYAAVVLTDDRSLSTQAPAHMVLQISSLPD
jgi:predicted nucleic acid-binding protein